MIYCNNEGTKANIPHRLVGTRRLFYDDIKIFPLGGLGYAYGGRLLSPCRRSDDGGSAASVVYSAVKIRRMNGEKKLPVMAVAGAFVFAAQMVNYDSGTGSSAISEAAYFWLPCWAVSGAPDACGRFDYQCLFLPTADACARLQHFIWRHPCLLAYP